MAEMLVVCPVKDESSTLERAVKSLQDQTYKDWILFIQDNNSSDDTGNIAQSYSLLDKRIKYNLSKQSLSALDNWFQGLEFGISHAKPSLVMFLAGDDYLFDREYLETLVNRVKRADGIIPIIADESGRKKIKLKISRFRTLNRLRLSFSWRYVHVAMGLYKTEYISKHWKTLKIRASKIDSSYYSSLDWALGYLLLSGRVRGCKEARYTKTEKGIAYDSDYYTGVSSPKIANITGERIPIWKLTNDHFNYQVGHIEEPKFLVFMYKITFATAKILELLNSLLSSLKYKLQGIS